MKLSDFVFAFPALLSAIMLTSAYGPGVINAIIAIGVYTVPIIAKLTRATSNGVLAREYALAARRPDAGLWPSLSITFCRISRQRLSSRRPSSSPSRFSPRRRCPILDLARSRRRPSWGRMLAEAQNVLYNAPGLAIDPGAAIALSVLGLNLLGDGLRDALDPKLKARS